MRDLKACQAEIFLRSEKRIKARKKRRNRILMTCIPMVLGIAVVTGVLWHRDPAASGSSTPENATYAQLSGIVAESSTNFIAKIDVVSGDGMLSYVEAGDIMQITDFLDRCTAQKPESAPMAPQDAPPAPESNQEEPEDNATIAGGRGEEPESDNKHSATGGLLDDFDVNTASDLTVILTGRDDTQIQYCLTDGQLIDLTHNETYILTPEQVAEFKDLLGVSQP